MDPEFEQKILELRRQHPRYALESYLFIFQALEFTVQRLGRQTAVGPERHISGRELLQGARDLASQKFGPLAGYVWNQWGIFTTQDIGEIVFLLVSVGLLKKRESDNKDDFSDGFDFKETFQRNYQIDLSRDKS